jgi:hypothetical protein
MLRSKRPAANESCTWEPPVVVERKIGEATKSKAVAEPVAPPPEPAPPSAIKLGFSVEWAFPLSKPLGE